MSVKIEQQLETLIEQMRQLNEATEDLGVSLGKLLLATGDLLATVNAPKARQAAQATIDRADKRSRAGAMRYDPDDYDGLTEFQKEVLSNYADKHNAECLPVTITRWEQDFMKEQLDRCLKYALSPKQAAVYEKVGKKLNVIARPKEDVDLLNPTPTRIESILGDDFDDDIPF